MATLITLIAGPTASGKSDLAIRMAERRGAIILNADAMQVYRDLRILTARPSLTDEARVPHHLYGMVEADVHWSVGAWVEAVKPYLTSGKPLVIVGGTGLYFRTLTHGLAHVPPVEQIMVDAVSAHYDEVGEIAFRTELAQVDPEANARIFPNDRIRLIRALAVYRATGVALSYWQGETKPLLSPDQWCGIVLAPPRATVVERITRRWQVMLDLGVVDEVRPLLERDFSSYATLRTAHGLPHLLAHLRGQMSLEQAGVLTLADTRQYAKRQMTWARGHMTDWEWVADADEIQ